MIPRTVLLDKDNADSRFRSNNRAFSKKLRSKPSNRFQNNNQLLRQISVRLFSQFPANFSYKDKNSLFPSAPKIGDSMMSKICKPIFFAARFTSSITL